jgi:stage V sporulation protein SpoVS
MSLADDLVAATSSIDDVATSVDTFIRELHQKLLDAQAISPAALKTAIDSLGTSRTRILNAILAGTDAAPAQ